MKLKQITTEFIHHLPYSAVGVGAALGLLLAVEKTYGLHFSVEFFHIAHPLHLFLSGAATAAVFRKYENNLRKTILIGFFGSILICTISDILFPYIASMIGGAHLSFHLCLKEEPLLIVASTLVGIGFGYCLIGIIERFSQFAHLAHVLVSSLASMLYLASFDLLLWQTSALLVFCITILAVWIPCCLSDIVFPLAFTKKETPSCYFH